MEESKALQQVLKESIKPLKKSLVQESWWQYVQDEVKQQLEWIINNLPYTYDIFPTIFYWSFLWSCRRRILNKQRPIMTMESALECLENPVMSEEAYQSGKPAVENVLEVQDWFRANDADVYACFVLRHKIVGLMESFMNLQATLMQSLEYDNQNELTDDDEKKDI